MPDQQTLPALEDPVVPNGGKLLYRVEFWQENRDHEPAAVRYIKAHSPQQAKRAIRERAREEARKGSYLLMSLLASDDVLMVVKQEDDTRSKAKRTRQEMNNLYSCKNCGTPLDDDYCQECGWRRQSWIERAMEKQGKTTLVGE